MSTTIIELEKAKVSLETSIQLLKHFEQKDSANTELHKALRDACIQRFEFCMELAWKVSIKILGLDTKAPNPAIRDMAQNNLIDDTQIWFEFLLARNKTSHSYDEDVARAVYKEAERIVPELNMLVTRLKKIK
ncbi:MAG: nucleotidyltransferase substrate binding protein [Bdellovibrionaceae bacterium]|nr:nucleotidyltransferase substrate binding protein [Pseudobdellovibrionaceae bacterium]